MSYLLKTQVGAGASRHLSGAITPTPTWSQDFNIFYLLLVVIHIGLDYSPSSLELLSEKDLNQTLDGRAPFMAN